MLIETYSGRKSDFQVEQVPGGRFRVYQMDETGAGPVDDAVLFQNRDVALAYARASAALDRYLSALDLSSDVSAEFDEWMALDEAYEMRMLEWRDLPDHVESTAVH